MQNAIYDQVRFQYPFRDYQKRVLDSLEEKLQDKKIHIVAAPGAGKTVLGLEVIRRLGKPALILVPSIGLREQWKDRFLNLFVSGCREEWESRLSDNLDQPGVLTCVTYQALYQRFCEEGFSDLLARYEQEGIKVICLDEAHHLKREWWKALEQVCSGIKDSVVLSLTATPPYDSTDQEWNRYRALCGEIDEEIFTPEMVQKGCLCPHQDYVFLCIPTKEEEEIVRLERRENEERIRQILKGEDLYRQIKAHPGLIDPEGCGKSFLEQPEYLTALLSYARTYGREQAYVFEEGRREAGQAFAHWDSRVRQALEDESIPPMDEALFELLLRGILDFDEESYQPAFTEGFRQELTEQHLLRSGRLVSGGRRREIDRVLKYSTSKLAAVEQIVRQEKLAMGAALRCLVLMDQVRREDLKKVETEDGLTDLGCVPVFERLRRMEHIGNLEAYLAPVTRDNPSKERRYSMSLGLLCASFLILPAQVMEELSLPAKPLGCTDYARADIPDSARKAIIRQVTQLFTEGKITVLIGTAALLGEGWDAPCVNTVVLGSVACTYVQSNQMRGRGLRIHKEHPEKITNIWHLATLEPDETRPDTYRAGEEYKRLCHRFDTMIGLSLDGSRMENGIGRLGLSGDIFTKSQIEAYQADMRARSADRSLVRMQWQQFLGTEKDFSTVRETVHVPVKPSFSFWRKDGLISAKQVSAFASGLCSAMKELSMLPASASVRIEKGAKNGAAIYLIGASEKESLLYARGLMQMCGPVKTPRYLLCQKKLFGRGRAYAVPDFLGGKKETAAVLFFYVRRRFMHLVYIQSEEGKRQLLKARLSELRIKRDAVRIVKSVCGI